MLKWRSSESGEEFFATLATARKHPDWVPSSTTVVSVALDTSYQWIERRALFDKMSRLLAEHPEKLEWSAEELEEAVKQLSEGEKAEQLVFGENVHANIKRIAQRQPPERDGTQELAVLMARTCPVPLDGEFEKVCWGDGFYATLDYIAKDGRSLVEFKTSRSVLPSRVAKHHKAQVGLQLLASGAEQAWMVFGRLRPLACRILAVDTDEYKQFAREILAHFWRIYEEDAPIKSPIIKEV